MLTVLTCMLHNSLQALQAERNQAGTQETAFFKSLKDFQRTFEDLWKAFQSPALKGLMRPVRAL